mmetsp:Transcript_5633/g.11542  ORF Transcript_5633/g.11542 Transcript_5633/m.11542 type:complete len:208 (-) Transcript_5633:857-1480(-)
MHACLLACSPTWHRTPHESLWVSVDDYDERSEAFFSRWFEASFTHLLSLAFEWSIVVPTRTARAGKQRTLFYFLLCFPFFILLFLCVTTVRYYAQACCLFLFFCFALFWCQKVWTAVAPPSFPIFVLLPSLSSFCLTGLACSPALLSTLQSMQRNAMQRSTTAATDWTAHLQEAPAGRVPAVCDKASASRHRRYGVAGCRLVCLLQS